MTRFLIQTISILLLNILICTPYSYGKSHVVSNLIYHPDPHTLGKVCEDIDKKLIPIAYELKGHNNYVNSVKIDGNNFELVKTKKTVTSLICWDRSKEFTVFKGANQQRPDQGLHFYDYVYTEIDNLPYVVRLGNEGSFSYQSKHYCGKLHPGSVSSSDRHYSGVPSHDTFNEFKAFHVTFGTSL